MLNRAIYVSLNTGNWYMVEPDGTVLVCSPSENPRWTRSKLTKHEIELFERCSSLRLVVEPN